MSHCVDALCFRYSETSFGTNVLTINILLQEHPSHHGCDWTYISNAFVNSLPNLQASRKHSATGISPGKTSTSLAEISVSEIIAAKLGTVVKLDDRRPTAWTIRSGLTSPIAGNVILFAYCSLVSHNSPRVIFPRCLTYPLNSPRALREVRPTFL